MAKNPAAAAATNDVRKQTFTLVRPIPGPSGELAALTLMEPQLKHMIVAERKKSRAEQAMSLISALSGVPEVHLKRLKIQDVRAMERWADGLRTSKTATVNPLPEGGAEVILTAPIQAGSATVSTIRLREPDLEASVAVESFEKPFEMTAAMIAALADLTIPVITQLTTADVAAIEEWLAPFVDSSSAAEAGAT